MPTRSERLEELAAIIAEYRRVGDELHSVSNGTLHDALRDMAFVAAAKINPKLKLRMAALDRAKLIAWGPEEKKDR